MASDADAASVTSDCSMEVEKVKDSKDKAPQSPPRSPLMKAVPQSILENPPWERTAIRADDCEDCELEALNRRRQYEKPKIRELEDDGGPQDCALNMKWANEWRNFVHNKTDALPTAVDNAHIHAGDHRLKADLIKDSDYLMIPSNIWTFLIQIYGGGPKIVPTKQALRQSPSRSRERSRDRQRREQRYTSPKHNHRAQAHRPTKQAPQVPKSESAQSSPPSSKSNA